MRLDVEDGQDLELYPSRSYPRHRAGLPRGAVWDEPRRPARRSGPSALVVAVLIALISAGTGGVAGWYAAATGTGALPSGVSTVADANPASVDGQLPGGLVTAARRVLPGVVSIEVDSGNEASTGSGFVIDGQRHIVTNNHVVASGGDITVTTRTGEKYPARLVGRDARVDIAVLQVRGDAPELRTVALGRTADVQVGEAVLAVGSPLGLEGSVTAGIVSAVNRPVRLGGIQQEAIQTDASINPGNSGGPLVNSGGAVIGVNTAIATTTQEGGSIGIGFAIPVDQALRTAQRLIKAA